MAELHIKIGSHVPGDVMHYQDGDILYAANDRHIRFTHAHHICHPREMTRLSSGLLPLDCLTAKFLELTSRYRYERVSRTEVIETDLITLQQEVIGSTPNDSGKVIHVVDQIMHKRLYSNPMMFGNNGSEVWYGKVDARRTLMDATAIWDMIESNTPERFVNYQNYPSTVDERKKYLIVSMDDFDDATMHDYMSPGYDQDGFRISKRKNFVNWRALTLPAQVGAIEDRNVEIDIRRNPIFSNMPVVAK